MEYTGVIRVTGRKQRRQQMPQQHKKASRNTFMQDLVKVMQNTLCQICYGKTEVLDTFGSWCKRCHKEFTDGMLHPEKRINAVELMRKYRKED